MSHGLICRQAEGGSMAIEGASVDVFAVGVVLTTVQVWTKYGRREFEF